MLVETTHFTQVEWPTIFHLHGEFVIKAVKSFTRRLKTWTEADGGQFDNTK